MIVESRITNFYVNARAGLTDCLDKLTSLVLPDPPTLTKHRNLVSFATLAQYKACNHVTLYDASCRRDQGFACEAHSTKVAVQLGEPFTFAFMLALSSQRNESTVFQEFLKLGCSCIHQAPNDSVCLRCPNVYLSFVSSQRTLLAMFSRFYHMQITQQ